jgi:hypothetical protein
LTPNLSPAVAASCPWRLCVVVLLLAAASARAEDIAACHAIADRDVRLACYDRVTARPIDGPATVPAAPAGMVPTASPAAVPDVPARPSDRGRRERPAEDAIAGAVIVDLLTTSIGRRQFLLDNGELWEQVEVRRVDLRKGDRVDLRPSALGAWQMRESNGKSRSLNVRRAN